jgi:hypothetical protein
VEPRSDFDSIIQFHSGLDPYFDQLIKKYGAKNYI